VRVCNNGAGRTVYSITNLCPHHVPCATFLIPHTPGPHTHHTSPTSARHIQFPPRPLYYSPSVIVVSCLCAPSHLYDQFVNGYMNWATLCAYGIDDRQASAFSRCQPLRFARVHRHDLPLSSVCGANSARLLLCTCPHAFIPVGCPVVRPSYAHYCVFEDTPETHLIGLHRVCARSTYAARASAHKPVYGPDDGRRSVRAHARTTRHPRYDRTRCVMRAFKRKYTFAHRPSTRQQFRSVHIKVCVCVGTRAHIYDYGNLIVSVAGHLNFSLFVAHLPSIVLVSRLSITVTEQV
jgi:hypothetical protein